MQNKQMITLLMNNDFTTYYELELQVKQQQKQGAATQHTCDTHKNVFNAKWTAWFDCTVCMLFSFTVMSYRRTRTFNSVKMLITTSPESYYQYDHLYFYIYFTAVIKDEIQDGFISPTKSKEKTNVSTMDCVCVCVHVQMTLWGPRFTPLHCGDLISIFEFFFFLYCPQKSFHLQQFFMWNINSCVFDAVRGGLPSYEMCCTNQE